MATGDLAARRAFLFFNNVLQKIAPDLRLNLKN